MVIQRLDVSRRWQAGLIAVLLASNVAGATPPATAQPTEEAALEAELDRLFEAMFANPGDLDVTFRYAEVATALGDYEAAVGALERMLVVNPNLPRVRLELGALYFRLEAYDIARVYLEEAVAGDAVPAPVQRRVDELLALIDERTRRHRFEGTLFAGARYQTNANFGPSSTVRLGNVTVDIDEGATGEHDYNAFLLGDGRYTYDLGTQAGDTLEVGGLAYGAFYREQSQLNLAVLEVDAGPRFELGPRGVRDTTLRPFVIASYVALDGATYSRGYGGGANATFAVTERLLLDGTYTGVREDFRQSGDFPTNDERDAFRNDVRGLARFAFTPRVFGELELGLGVNTADEDFRSFTEYRTGGRVVVALDAPFAALTEPWYTSFSAFYRRVNYDAAEPLPGSPPSRGEDDWRFGAALNAGLVHGLTAVGRVDYRNVDSNVELYEFDNFALTLGLLWRF